MTLKFDAYIPATMAAIYLLLLLYFKASAATSRSPSTTKKQPRRPDPAVHPSHAASPHRDAVFILPCLPA
jgi:hypothetical protein